MSKFNKDIKKVCVTGRELVIFGPGVFCSKLTFGSLIFRPFLSKLKTVLDSSNLEIVWLGRSLLLVSENVLYHLFIDFRCLSLVVRPSLTSLFCKLSSLSVAH